MFDEQWLRLRCIELAAEISPYNILRTAREFEKFILEGV